MNEFPRLAQRLFNTPLAIDPAKLEVVVAAVAGRFGATRIVRMDGRDLPMGAWDDEDMDYSAPGRSARAGYECIGGIAVIQLCGTLVKKLGTLKPYSGMTGYDGFRQNFMAALADPQVRGICFDIDSPGGEVAGCFDLADTIYASRGEKPIWSILNEKALSAAYVIASAGDRIVVPRTGNTGSIGVIVAHADLSKSLSEQGVTITLLTYGARKADGNPAMPLSEEARSSIQADVDAVGQMLDQTVARNRGTSPEKIRAMQAGTYLGADGVAAGLADAVMAPDAAFRAFLQDIS